LRGEDGGQEQEQKQNDASHAWDFNRASIQHSAFSHAPRPGGTECRAPSAECC
jgi:hypothetical protein